MFISDTQNHETVKKCVFWQIHLYNANVASAEEFFFFLHFWKCETEKHLH
jgi:hypothetical protein